MTTTKDPFTYRVTWSEEDGEHVGLCAEFPSLSWLARTPEGALRGIRRVVAEVVADQLACGEEVPSSFAEQHFSGRLVLQVPPEVHRSLAIQAAEAGISVSRLASAKLSR